MSAIFPDPEDVGKIFVGGLSSSTTKESLCGYFSKFGEVIDSVVMTNNETGRSRGFGFVTFKDPKCVFNVVKQNYHELDGKKIDPKECTPRSMQKVRRQTGKCKVFLGGLSPNISEEDIRNGMSKFGKVDQVVIMYDQETKKCRGFGFLSFELEESIEQACAERYVIINGKQIECKKAEPRISAKSLNKSYDMSKNGYGRQFQIGQMTPTNQNNWNSPTNQALFGLHGSPYPNYPAYSPTPIASPPLNAVSPGYTAVQPVPYMQPYPAAYGSPVPSYNYTPVSTNTYPQTNYMNSQAADVNGQNVTAKEAEKSYAGFSAIMGEPVKIIGGSAIDATYSTQRAPSASSYQRYHPYQSK